MSWFPTLTRDENHLLMVAKHHLVLDMPGWTQWWNPRLLNIWNVRQPWHCLSVKCGELDDALRYELYQMEVPPLIVPPGLNGDDLSIGDLTATTHEIHIASEATLLERARQKYRECKPVRMLVPLPVAFSSQQTPNDVHIQHAIQQQQQQVQQW
jgi:hypothetical protein